MHHTAARPAPGATPHASAFDPMSCPAVIEAGKQLVSGRINPRQFDAVIEHERATWQQRAAGARLAVASPHR